MEKAYNDFAAYTQENIDAFVRANAVLTKGFEQMSKSLVGLASKSMEEAVETGKKLVACKSISELLELQSKWAQEAIDTFLSEGKKVQELSTSIMKDATAPLAERFKATVVTGTAAAKESMKAATSPAAQKKAA